MIQRIFILCCFIFGGASLSNAQIQDTLIFLTDFSPTSFRAEQVSKFGLKTMEGDSRSGISSLSYDASQYKAFQPQGDWYVMLVPKDFNYRQPKNASAIDGLTSSARGNKYHLTSDKKALVFSCNCRVKISNGKIVTSGGKLKPGGNNGKTKVVLPEYVK